MCDRKIRIILKKEVKPFGNIEERIRKAVRGSIRYQVLKELKEDVNYVELIRRKSS